MVGSGRKFAQRHQDKGQIELGNPTPSVGLGQVPPLWWVSTHDTSTNSLGTGLFESPYKLLSDTVLRGLVSIVLMKPCRPLHGDLRHKAHGQMEHLLLPGKGLRSEACLNIPMQATSAHNRSSKISVGLPLAYLPESVVSSLCRL